MDLTQHPMPTIKMTGKVRELSAAECEAKAQECRDDLARLLSGPTKRWVASELRGWERAAAERGFAEAVAQRDIMRDALRFIAGADDGDFGQIAVDALVAANGARP